MRSLFRESKIRRNSANYFRLVAIEMTDILSSNQMTAVIRPDDNLSSDEMTSKEKINFTKEMSEKPIKLHTLTTANNR